MGRESPMPVLSSVSHVRAVLMVAHTPTSAGTLKVRSTICTPPTPPTLGRVAFCYICIWFLLLSVLASVTLSGVLRGFLLAVLRCHSFCLTLQSYGPLFIYANLLWTFFYLLEKNFYFCKQKNNLFPIYVKNALKCGQIVGVCFVGANCTQSGQIVRAYIIKAKGGVLHPLQALGHPLQTWGHPLQVWGHPLQVWGIYGQ